MVLLRPSCWSPWADQCYDAAVRILYENDPPPYLVERTLHNSDPLRREQLCPGIRVIDSKRDGVPSSIKLHAWDGPATILVDVKDHATRACDQHNDAILGWPDLPKPQVITIEPERLLKITNI